MGEITREITVRKAGPEDADAVYEIGTLCFSDAWRRETVIHDMEGAHSQYFTACRNGNVVGYACFWFVLDEAQLVNIGVRPANRRQGVAKKLFDAGLEEARKRKAKTLFLEVRVSNLPAQSLYEQYGLQIKGTRRDVYELPREDGYIMSREI